MRAAFALPVLALGCRGPSGDAGDLCRAEHLSDALEDGARVLGIQVPDEAGGTVHAEVRWPAGAAAAADWPTAVVLHGAWDPVGTPVDRSSMRVDVAGGLVDIHLDFPGNGGTTGTNDRRGAASRAAVATVLRWAAGERVDSGGCTLSDRIPGADPDRLYVVGTSNGGNLAIATLADATLSLPPVAGLITWETPAGPPFTNVELGAHPTIYTPGSCRYTAATGIVCEMPGDQLVAVGEPPTLCFDLDDDQGCGANDVTVRGTEDPETGLLMLSPGLVEAATSQGLTLAGYADADTALHWWAERDAARLAGALVTAQPDLPVMLLASEVDHVQTLADHPHVFGLGEALQRAGVAWTRLNPGRDWLAGMSDENPPNASLRLADASGALVPEEAEESASALLTAAVLELSDRKGTGDW